GRPKMEGPACHAGPLRSCRDRRNKRYRVPTPSRKARIDGRAPRRKAGRSHWEWPLRFRYVYCPPKCSAVLCLAQRGVLLARTPSSPSLVPGRFLSSAAPGRSARIEGYSPLPESSFFGPQPHGAGCLLFATPEGGHGSVPPRPLVTLLPPHEYPDCLPAPR